MEEQVVQEVLRRYPDLRMSYEEFLGLGADVHGDWIDGRVRLQVAGETDVHSNVLGFDSALMNGYAEETVGGEFLLLFQMRPREDLPSREVDLLNVAPENQDRLREYFVDGPADLVVEVVSDQSRRRDRVHKLAEYEAGGVREYWLIGPVLEHAELYRLGEDGRFAQVAAGHFTLLRSEVIPGMWFRAEWFWPDSMPMLRDVWKEWGLV